MELDIAYLPCCLVAFLPQPLECLIVSAFARTMPRMPISAKVMFQRIFYGAVAIAVLLFLFHQDAMIAEGAVGIPGRVGSLMQRGSILPILFLAILVTGSIELSRMMRINGANPHSGFAAMMVGAMVVAPWLSAGGLLGSTLRDEGGLYWSMAVLMFSALGGGILTVLRGETQGALRDTAATMLMIIYLGFLGSFGLQLRCSIDTPRQEGVWLLLITVMVTKCSDIGAFFVGSAIGRRKLAPAISPGKSVEGFFGGLLGSVVAALSFVYASPIFTFFNASGAVRSVVEMATRSFSMPTDGALLNPFWRAVIFGIVMSGFGQLGDLLESCFKRDAGVKDSGNLIPKYGGMLDLIDSPLLTMPAAWFLFTSVWNLT